jgi:hypothetical protein
MIIIRMLRDVYKRKKRYNHAAISIKEKTLYTMFTDQGSYVRRKGTTAHSLMHVSSISKTNMRSNRGVMYLKHITPQASATDSMISGIKFILLFSCSIYNWYFVRTTGRA